MRLKSLVLTASLALLICACGANSKEAESVTSSEVTEETKAVEESSDNSAAAGAINTKSVTTQVSTVASKESMSFETVDETIYVQGDNVNLRSKPDSTSEKITAFNKGEELKRIGRSEKWSKVMYKDKEAYISSEFVSTQKPKVEETQAQSQVSDGAEIGLNPSWKYADFSKINSGSVCKCGTRYQRRFIGKDTFTSGLNT